MILFLYSLLLAINFGIFVGDANIINNVCSRPKNYDFSPARFQKHLPTSLTMESNKQLLNYVSPNISNYANLAKALSGPSTDLNSILDELKDHLTLKRKLFIRPTDIAQSINKNEAKYSEDVIESNFANILNQLSSVFPDFNTTQSTITTGSQLVMANHIDFKVELEYQKFLVNETRDPTTDVLSTQKIYEYQSELSKDVTNNLDFYKLKLKDSSPVDIFVVACADNVTLEGFQQTLFEFDYSTVTGIRNVPIYLPEIHRKNERFFNLSPIEVDHLERIPVIEATDIHLTSHNSTPVTKVELDNFSYTPRELWIAIVHKKTKMIIALEYINFSQSFYSMNEPMMKTAYFCSDEISIPDILRGSKETRKLSNDIAVTSPIAIYYQTSYITNKIEFVPQYYYGDITMDRLYCKYTHELWKSAVEAITDHGGLQIILDQVYYHKEFPNVDLVASSTVVDFTNETQVESIKKATNSGLNFPNDLSHVLAMWISKIGINLQLDNNKYKLQSITDQDADIPMMSVKSDVFFHCLNNRPGEGKFIYRLPLTNPSTVQVYVIEVEKGDNAVGLFGIDFTKLITREPLDQQDIWLPEVHSQGIFYRIDDKMFEDHGDIYEFHALQNISTKLTAWTNLEDADPTKTRQQILTDFIYVVVHSESGMVVATGYHKEEQRVADILNNRLHTSDRLDSLNISSFAIDFYSKIHRNTEKSASSALGFYLNNLGLNYVDESVPYKSRLRTLLHNDSNKIKESTRIRALNGFSIRNKLFICESDLASELKYYHEQSEVALEMVNFREKKKVVDVINNFSMGIINEEDIKDSDRLVMVSDVQVKLFLLVNGKYRNITVPNSSGANVIKTMMPLSTKKHTSPAPDCLGNAIYYQLPLPESIKNEVDVYIIVPDDKNDELSKDIGKCMNEVHFLSSKAEESVTLWVPDVEIVDKFHFNLKEAMDDSSSTDLEKVHLLQKVSFRWLGSDTTIGEDLTTAGNDSIASKFLWAVVSKKDGLWIHGSYSSFGIRNMPGLSGIYLLLFILTIIVFNL